MKGIFKKTGSLLLAAVMLLGVVGTGFVGFNVAAAGIPEGYTPIYDIEDLYGVRNNLSGNYILMADIDMTEDTASGGDWDTNGCGWLPIGVDEDNPFSGAFDGNGHSIIGMRINGKPSERIGLFGVISGGEVENLKIVNATITTTAESAGTLSGEIKASSTIKNIAIINTSVTNNNSYISFASGLIGKSGAGTISNSFVTGTVTGSTSSRSYSKVSGITTCGTGLTIQNCYNLSNVNKGREASGIATMYTSSSPIIKNCINIGDVGGYPLVDDWVFGPTSGYDAHYEYDNYTLIGNYYLNGSGANRGTELKIDSQSTVLGVTATQLKSEVALANLDFENTWFIDNATGIEHPQLQSNPEVDAESITIKSLPKQQFLHHDEFDCTGLTVTVEYENGTTSERTLGANAVSGYDMSDLGTQTLTVKFLSAETTYDIIVNERPIDSIVLSESDVVMDINTTKELSVTYAPATATNQTVTWSSDDESVATVDENGIISAIGKGTAIITATTDNGISESCYVEVLVPAKTVSLSDSLVTIQPNETYKLTVTLDPENTTDTVSWSSSDEDIATVDENGVVTAVSTGNATIVATTSRSKFASCNIQVRIFSTELTINPTAEVNVGETFALTAKMMPENTTDSITWKSSDSTVASVSSAGVITAKKVGNVTVTATTTSGIKATCEVSVLKPSTSISLDKTEVIINKGTSEALISTILPADSTDGVIWKSSNESVATVNNGVVTAVGKGTAIITAKADSGVSATCVINVLIPSTTVQLDKALATIIEGATLKLNATMGPDETTDTVIWTSSAPEIASVSNSGVVSALANGEAVIIATATSGKTAECKVTVIHNIIDTVTEPTCTEGGFTTHTCSFCGYTYTDSETESNGHNIIDVEAKEPTCIEAGWNAYEYCTECDYTTYEEISADNHSFGNWITAREATCTENGLEYRVCEDCSVIEHNVIPAKTHKWDTKYTVDKEPTCTTAGAKSIHCTACNETKSSMVIPATGHTKVIDSAVESTCTATGLTQGSHCSVCNAVLVAQETVAIKNHSYGDWITVKAPTCTDDGFDYRECKDCGFIENRNVNENGHNWERNYTIDKAATCTETGEKSIHCSVCDVTKNSTVIPETGHTEVIDSAVEATCTATGLTEGSHCSVCNTVLVAQETVEIKNHAYGEWITVKTPTCTDDGFDYRECNDCGFIENRSIDENGHNWESDYTVDKAATCTTDGAKSIHCADCNATKDNEVIAKNGHDYGEWIVSIEAECERIGVKHRECEVCEFAQFEEIEQLNHDWEKEYTIDAPSTCTAKGSKSYHCTRCEEKNDITVIPANGHSAGEWEIKTPATYLANGEEIKKCTICDVVLEERAIAKLVSPAVNIKTPSTTTINYGDKIVLHAETSKALPNGWRIKWTADNSNFTYSVSADASTCTISPELNGSTTFTATVYDENGNVMSTDTQKMTSKAGFFDKLSAFFRNLFGGAKIIPQVFKFIF